MLNRLSLVVILGFCSGLPFALVGSTLQAWFASTHLSVGMSTAFSLLGLPYFFRLIWGPIVDRYTLSALGRRRSWILLSQGLLLIGFNLLAWCSPVNNPYFLAGLAFFLAILSSIQDVVIDAHRIEYLPKQAYGLGASLAVTGYRVALMLGGGLALIMAAYWGFPCVYRSAGFLMSIGLVAVLLSKEPTVVSVENKTPVWTSLVDPISDFLGRKNYLPFIGFILFFKLGQVFTATYSGVVMPFLIQGLGFPLTVIGFINKICGTGAILLGGFIAGFVLLKRSLFESLFIFGLLQAFSHLFFVALAVVGQQISLLAFAVFFDNLAVGMGSTTLVVLFMTCANKKYTATQFSLFVAISILPQIFSGPIAAFLQARWGWVGVYEAAFVASFGFIPFLKRIRGDGAFASALRLDGQREWV